MGLLGSAQAQVQAIGLLGSAQAQVQAIAQLVWNKSEELKFETVY